MTDREKAIITAYTGITMLTGEKFSIFHKYIEDLLGRPIWTHELANSDVWEEIKEKSKPDFIKLCQDEAAAEKMTDLISREALKKHKVYSLERHEYVVPVYNIDNAPTVVNVKLTSEKPQGDLILSLTELCNRYCKNCPITNVSNECTDCICTHIRGITKGGAE